MIEFDKLLQEAIEEYQRGECTELNDEFFDSCLSPKAIERVNKEVELRFKDFEVNKKQRVL